MVPYVQLSTNCGLDNFVTVNFFCTKGLFLSLSWRIFSGAYKGSGVNILKAEIVETTLVGSWFSVNRLETRLV